MVKALKTALIVLPLLASACAEPARRIKASKEFPTYSAATQNLIRRREIAEGFTHDMVQLALGGPQRRFVRTTSKGNMELWAYVNDDQRAPPAWGQRIGYEGGVFIEPNYFFGVEYLRVGFQNDSVVLIERIPLKKPAMP